MSEVYRERALADLIAAERDLRESAERLARDYRALVLELAQRLAGEALEARRREDPSVPQGWTPAEWRAFFLTALPGTGQSGWTASNNGHHAALERKIEQLEKEVAGLRERLNQAQMALTRVERERDHAQREAERWKAKAEEKPKAQGSETAVQRRLPTLDDLPDLYRTLARDLEQMIIPQAPGRFEQALRPEDGIRYRRKVLILKAISAMGLCARLEIDRVISVVEGISPRTNSVRRPAEELVESGLLIGDSLRIEHPITTGLAVYRLSEDGRALCREWGWAVVENEWERVLRLHQGEAQEAHTVMILAFALHARLRGWNAVVLPEVEGTNAAPDVLVERGEERWYVEVERGDGSRRKWKNLAGLNGGQVALCAADGMGRARLVRDCKAEGLSGVATDLEGLIFEDGAPRDLVEITPSEPLWIERW
ncbi:hypothetical protein SE15_03290 [Thermanaerothrix daxensis]|uniref:Uncharacterized protein n=1 Tax=Thermanaerothrix daxensis TaxID=869279 RepID=A0A0P6YN65_9CHLR|nr:hypothetical protein [Thermanaerothrix daxensis]KPL84199.1 hypothetical protein SE15_03290 [Thermanaerothrix daxensis]